MEPSPLQAENSKNNNKPPILPNGHSEIIRWYHPTGKTDTGMGREPPQAPEPAFNARSLQARCGLCRLVLQPAARGPSARQRSVPNSSSTSAVGSTGETKTTETPALPQGRLQPRVGGSRVDDQVSTPGKYSRNQGWPRLPLPRAEVQDDGPWLTVSHDDVCVTSLGDRTVQTETSMDIAGEV